MRSSKWDHNLKGLCLWEEEKTPELCFSTLTLRKGHGAHSVMMATYKPGRVLTRHQILFDVDLGLSSFQIWEHVCLWYFVMAALADQDRDTMIRNDGYLVPVSNQSFQKVGATHWHKCCLLDVVMGWIVSPPNLYIDILTPSTVECDFTWNRGPLQCS